MSAPKNRSLFGRLLLLFTIVPVIELSLLVWLGGRIGFWPTVGIIAGTAVVGSYLAHREGLSALARFRSSMASGEMPGEALTDGIVILVAGAFLLTPGVLTDAVGFLGLFPPTRALIKRAVSKRVKSGLLGGSVSVSTWPPTRPADIEDTDIVTDIVDVDFQEVKREELG